MKKNRLIIIPALLLLLLAAWVVYDRQPFGRENISFAVEQGSFVTKIEFQKGNETLTLTRIEDTEGWLVNGKSEVRKGSILFINKVLTGMEIKSPVSIELFNDEVIGGGIEPVKVKVFEGRRCIKSFLVYQTDSNLYGNIMQMKSGTKPFIVYVPGFDVEIGSAFTLHEEYWQPYTIYDLMPSEIAYISFDNHIDTASSFEIQKMGNECRLLSSGLPVEGYDMEKVDRYLSYYIMVPFESWAFDISKAQVDSIVSRPPLYTISVKDVTGNEKTTTIWPRFVDGAVDTNRVVAKTNDSDKLVILRYFDVDPILKKIDYFF